MAKSLPESLDLTAAVRKEWQMQGELLISDLDRMPAELIASADAPVKYDIQFRHSKQVLGEAVIKIESDLDLICQRSLDSFEFTLKTVGVIGFVSEIEDLEKLDADVSPSWVEDMKVDPKALIEDEILLKIPPIPLKPGAELNTQYLADHDDSDTDTEEKQNPFAALNDLKSQLKNKN